MAFDVVVIGASAGGIEALTEVVAQFPAELDAAVFVAMHFPPEHASALPHILTRQGALFATHAIDRAPIAPGRIFIAQPDYHLILDDGVMRVVRGPKENGHRPAIDVLFRTAAGAYREQVTGVILSGTLDDGTSGLTAIKAAGGIAIVQEPEDAAFPSMPASAIANVAVDYTLPASAIGEKIAQVVAQRPEGGAPASKLEQPVFERHDPERPKFEKGVASGFVCPECNGALWELEDGRSLRFHCRIGHAFSAESVMAEHTVALENSLWAAIRALEEKAEMAERLASRTRSPSIIRRLQAQADDAHERARTVRQALFSRLGPGAEASG